MRTSNRARQEAITLRNTLTGNKAAQQLLKRLPLPTFVTRRVPPSGPHVVRLQDGLSFVYEADPCDIMARQVIWDDWSSWEITSRNALIPHFREARSVWDVGAYAGVYSMLACAVNPDLKVLAFEPVPRHASWLRANIAANRWEDRITVIDAAVSDHHGAVELTVVDDDITASGLGVAREGSVIQVAAVRLDEFEQTPDVIKIDIEGHEVAALSTVAEMLSDRQPVILTECLNQTSLQDMMDLLSPLGYVLFHLAEEGPAHVWRSFEVPGGNANFVALPSKDF
jgi:FkbM family methyltransferase